MFCYIHILLLLILVSIICLPTQEPQQQLKFFAKEEFLIKEGNSKSYNLKINSEKDSDSTYIDSTKVVVNFYKDETIENHELNVTAKNLAENSYISSYYVQMPKENGKTLDKISHSCKLVKLSNDKASDKECKSSFKEEGDKYTLSFNTQLFKSDKLIIKFRYSKIPKTKGVLYRREYFSIQSKKDAEKCDYTFIIPQNYKSLGLKYNNLKKETNNKYYYKGNCPDEKLEETFRMSPIKTYWKTDESYYIQSSEPISGNITFTFLRMYKGGKSRFKDYKLTTNEGVVLDDSELINNEVYLKTELPGKNNKNVGVNLHTAFTNNLNNDFILYTDKYYELNKNIDKVIESKVDEILNDPNSKYKDYPDYYKLGKFVNNYMTYDLSYTGKNLTALEIFNERRGVCEHYTLLYNTMLNKIGIKTLTIIGYGFEDEKTSANENTSGHAWTGALIDGKWKEIDVTWDLLEGISSAHILKGFNEERYSYGGANDLKLYKSIKLQMIDNLDTEEANYMYIEPQLKYNYEEDKKDDGNNSSEPTYDIEDTNTDMETFKIFNPRVYAIKLSISIYFYIFYLLLLL